MLIGVGIGVVADIGVLPLSEVVVRRGLVTAEHLDCGRALDAIFLGQFTVGHDIDGTKSDLLTREILVSNGFGKLWFERLTVWAPVSVEGDHPDVFIVAIDRLSPVGRGELLDTVEHCEGLCGHNGERCSEREFHSFDVFCNLN